MIKSELNMFLSQLMPHIAEKKIADASKHIIEALALALETQKRIEIRGFGSFSLHHRPQRLAFNPKTQKRIHTEAKSIPHFKPGKALREGIEASRQKYPIKD
jgi:integration host factor subunit beta